MSIFNRRRRPRQAVYASPQSQSVTTITTADVPDEQLVDIARDFDTGYGNNSFMSNQNPSGSAHYGNTSSARPFQTRIYSPQKHPRNQFGNENAQPKFESNYFGARPNNVTSSGQRPTMMHAKPSSNNVNNFSNRPQNAANNGFISDKTPVKQQPQKQFSWSNTNTYSPMKAGKADDTARQPGENDKASFGTRQNQNIKRIKVEQNPMNKAATGEDKFTLRTVDKSMKFITATIQGLRKWSEYREQIPLVFEVFATLDSVPTSNNNGTAKLFNIKDSTGKIRCIFWEMDKTLPRIARGQIYRLVGALERKTGQYQCFTIRPVQPIEQRLATKQVTMCDNAMATVVLMIAEA